MARSLQLFCLLGLAVCPCAARAEVVAQSAREIPLVGEVDVVVVGGTIGAVAAAVEAARGDAEVMLIAPRNYLGEDLCATLRMWYDGIPWGHSELIQDIFGEDRTTSPLRVKRTLESALLKAHVRFLLGCYPTDILVDAQGNPAGIVMANRAGRQAVAAKVIIDATHTAVVARMADAQIVPRPSETPDFRRVVLGGEDTSAVPAAHSVPAGVELNGQPLDYYEYRLDLDLGDGSFAALAEAEQKARDLTYREGQLRAAEQLSFLPAFTIKCRQRPEAGPPRVGLVPVECMRPEGVDRLYVLGPAAGLDWCRDAVYTPALASTLGGSVGHAAAHQAAGISLSKDIAVRRQAACPSGSGNISETLRGLRWTEVPKKTVACPEQGIPVLTRVDVVVVGGGTSGACAAIGAARRGAKVLVVEFQEGLGGVGTVGLIGKPYHGKDRGFTKEVPFPDKEHNNESKMEWFRRQVTGAGGKVWFGVLGCGAYVEGNRVRGAVVATPEGRGVVLADVVIDATGNGDIAVAAGAESMYGGGPSDIALQGTGLPRRLLGKAYVNTDFLLVDEADAVDTWRALVGSRLAVEGEPYDMGSFIQTRERRRVVGDHLLTYLDQIAERTYPDSIVLSGSDYDSHGYPSEPYFALIPHTKKTLKANHPAPGGTCFTPYRCLLPRGLEGILVIGLAISMDRDASAMVRMQKDMHNQGYAAGVAAAMASQSQCTPRQIDVKALQRHLVEIGNLPEQVLPDKDSYPLSQQQIDSAVADVVDEGENRQARCRALAMLLSHADLAVPGLKRAFQTSLGAARLEYAKLLGFLGEADGVELLAERLNAVDAWDAKIFQGNMAEYAHLPTPLDALILALGYSGDRRALPAILKKLDMLDADVTLSHHRSVALALEALGDPAAAEPLGALLRKPGMSGHAMTGLEPLHDQAREKRRRIGPLREIVLARALYRCGDCEGLGEKVLREYQDDLRGLFARHATEVLNAQRQP